MVSLANRHACEGEPTITAFALPDSLSPKADPALIASDERHFAALERSLEDSIRELSERLISVRKQPGGSGQETLDRDLEIHRLSASLRTRSRYGMDLCLGHTVGSDSAETLYIGRLGLSDGDGDGDGRG